MDVNLIPISGLQRVEVLKDGASSIYGSDAVAGVVNFVMYGDRTLAPYEGAEFELRYGNTTDTDRAIVVTSEKATDNFMSLPSDLIGWGGIILPNRLARSS